MKICGKVVPDTVRQDAWWYDRNSQSNSRVRGRSEATRQQHILGLPISAHTASACIIHSSVCLWVSTPPSLSSFLLKYMCIYTIWMWPSTFSSQCLADLHVRLSPLLALYANSLPITQQHFSGSHFLPSFLRHPQMLPWNLLTSAPFRYHPLPTCLSINTRAYTHVNVLEHVHAYRLCSISTC